ncbi:hypothetical protein CU097_004354 [Rhizopus azygosporus]|uniref:CHCH domain-containing protein n=1 Tax=Rhizopus azygosporus TaxID=86630 RepID=A0A367IT38_RHIAZ|nr:hypothetical protein CU097_004354 [Rhizopus azygosporus]
MNSDKRTLCDYVPLKECLAKNNNDRSKCLKEWNEFQQACRQRKQATNDKSECEACKQ